jgi:aspartyl-tRNA(Asn)/glutamyl-tRNA(Gln) amidotransferase subunit A
MARKMAATIENIASALAKGQTTSQKLVEECLAAIKNPAGEGSRTFLNVAGEKALACAQAMDVLRKNGQAPSPYAGIPVSIKDLFDLEGEITRSGSTVLANAKPAVADATAIARWKAAGLIVIGRTNMTEFAFSGVGINPHYGTPKSAFDRETGRVPGGSSSGAAIALTDGMSHGSLGTDTGGSCRIPAVFNWLVGYKPTARRIPSTGAFPLSTTLDSIGPLGRSVACCAILDSILAGEAPNSPPVREVAGLRIAIPKSYVLNDMEPLVARAFENALARLSKAGALVREIQFPEIDEIPSINAKGGFSAPESLATHRDLIAAHRALYDGRVLSRIERGHEQSASDYVDLMRHRSRIIAAFNGRMQDYDLLAYPTVPIIPPAIADFEKDADFARLNLLILRNPSVINMLDGCSISVPMTHAPEPPAGLMLSAPTGRDKALLIAAAAIEKVLA